MILRRDRHTTKPTFAGRRPLSRAITRLNAELDLQAVLQTVCEEAAAVFHAKAVEVMLVNSLDQSLQTAMITGMDTLSSSNRSPVPVEAYAKIAHDGVFCFLPPDHPAAQHFVQPDRIHPPSRSILAVRLAWNGDLIGYLNLYSEDPACWSSKAEIGLIEELANQAALAIAKARLYDDAQQRLKYLQALRTIDVAIASTADIKLTLNIVLDEGIDQLKVDAADILVFNRQTQQLQFTAGRGFRTAALQHTNLALGEGFAGVAAMERRTIQIPNLNDCDQNFHRSPHFHAEDFVAYFGVPLIAKGELAGVLEIFHRTPLYPDRNWYNFLETLAGQAAIAIDNALLFHDLQRSNSELTLAYDSTIEGWSRVLELRDRETQGHTQRVTDMTLRLAQLLGLPDDDLIHIRRGALLHDIGKMSVPDDILHKPAPLTPDEWIIMRQHPIYAVEMLGHIPFLQRALVIPQFHHERWDGSGYPNGLKGIQIPLPARIFAVPDVFDALTSDRPYRKAWSHAQALDYLRAQSGTHFDPTIVAVFLKNIRSPESMPLASRLTNSYPAHLY
ncbi:MAG TPA: HD domain-containing phosphohydrolase [Anaerolineaceae bacterium]